MRWFLALLVVVGALVAYYGSWLRPMRSLGIAVATVGAYYLLASRR